MEKKNLLALLIFILCIVGGWYILSILHLTASTHSSANRHPRYRRYAILATGDQCTGNYDYQGQHSAYGDDTNCSSELYTPHALLFGEAAGSVVQDSHYINISRYIGAEQLSRLLRTTFNVLPGNNDYHLITINSIPYNGADWHTHIRPRLLEYGINFKYTMRKTRHIYVFSQTQVSLNTHSNPSYTTITFQLPENPKSVHTIDVAITDTIRPFPSNILVAFGANELPCSTARPKYVCINNQWFFVGDRATLKNHHIVDELSGVTVAVGKSKNL